MKTIKFNLSDEEYTALMEKAEIARDYCKKRYRGGKLKPVKTFIAMCAKQNLIRNVERYAREVMPK
jgi:hypothetical protein